MTDRDLNQHLPGAPFPGIDPFSYAERNVFFARERESRALIRLVVIHRGVLLYSDSGTGKSSLINAGLLPHAIAEGFQPERLRVQPRPNEEIVVQRLSETGNRQSPFLPSIFSDSDSRAREVLTVETFLETVHAKARAARPLLIFDQFEEWFTLFDEGASGKSDAGVTTAQQKICEAIVSLLTDNSLPVKILLVLREDYLAKLTPFFKRCPNLPDQYLRLMPLKGSDIQRIIKGPFNDFPGHYQPEISDSLAQMIRKEFESRSIGEAIRLSEVQIVCRALFESGKGSADLEQYFVDQGGVQGILEQYLRQALDSLPEQQRDPAVGLLSRMVTAAGTRNVISDEDVVRRVENEDNIARDILYETLESLEQDTKLVRRERRREVYFYEIASEFLVEWIRLQAKERAEQRRIAETQKALQEEQRRAAEQEKKAARERRRARVLFVALLLAALAAVVAVIMYGQAETQRTAATQAKQAAEDSAGVAIRQRARADSALKIADSLRVEAEQYAELVEVQRDKAVAAEQDAVIERNKAVAAEKEAKLQRDAAIQARKQALRNLKSVISLKLAVTAPRQIEIGNARLGALLALEAYRFGAGNTEQFPNQIYQALNKAVNASDLHGQSHPQVLSRDGGWIRSLSYSWDGSRLAAGNASGRITISDSDGQNALSFQAHAGGVRTLLFVQSGKTIISGSEDDTILRWNIDDIDAGPDTLGFHQDRVLDMVASADGNSLITSGTDSTVQIWDLTANAQHRILAGYASSIRAVAVNKQGQFAAGDAGGTIHLQSIEESMGISGELKCESQIRALAFDPGGRYLAAGTQDGRIWLWQPEAHSRKPLILYGHEQQVNALTFSHDGKLLASASSDHSVRVWDMDKPENQPAVLTEHSGSVWTIRFKPGTYELASGSADQAIRIWSPTAELLIERLQKLLGDCTLSEQQWRQFVGPDEEFVYPYSGQPNCE